VFIGDFMLLTTYLKAKIFYAACIEVLIWKAYL